MSADKDQVRLAHRNCVAASGLAAILGAYALVVSLAALVVQAASPFLVTLRPEQRDPIHSLGVSHGVAAVVLILLSAIFRRRKRLRACVPRVMFALTPLLALVSVDRVLNVFYPPPFQPRAHFRFYVRHPRRGWTHAPLAHTTENGLDTYIDRYGMRVTEKDWHRRLGDRPRVLFLGDSITFGFRVPADAAYVERVQALLNQRDDTPHFRALNGGTNAAAPWQELDWLGHEGADIKPDLVVVQICMNDITYMLHPAVLAHPNVHAIEMQGREQPRWSAIVRLAYEWGRKQRYGGDLNKAAERIETDNFDRLLDKEASKQMWKAWDRSTGDWEKMISFCKSRRIPIAFFVAPLDRQVDSRDVTDEPQRRIEALAKKHHVPCYDLLPFFRSLHLDKGVPISDLYRDSMHFSVKGHAMVAKELLAFLDANGLLEKARAHWKATRGG